MNRSIERKLAMAAWSIKLANLLIIFGIASGFFQVGLEAGSTYGDNMAKQKEKPQEPKPAVMDAAANRYLTIMANEMNEKLNELLKSKEAAQGGGQ